MADSIVNHEESAKGSAVRYALLFRTHFWDDFAQRQFDRVKVRALSADIYVLVDETRGRIRNIKADLVFGITDDEILSAGFVAAGGGSIQWYSGDVPLYMFYEQFPKYDYYIQMEYDVAIHTDLDQLIERVASDGVDVLALTNKEGVETWPWLATCAEAYRAEEIRCQLICFSAFSNKGLRTLYNERLKQAIRYKEGSLKEWPYCEGYIATEAARQGLNVAELSRYGDVKAYDWWPPFVESQLPSLAANAFVHPVLDPVRYISSLFKKPQGLRWLLMPNSWLHVRLRRLGPIGYVRALGSGPYLKELHEKLSRRFRRAIPR